MLKAFNIPMFSYLRLSRTAGVAMQDSPRREPAPAAQPSQHAAAALREESPRSASAEVELPNEIWGEIASFSSRTEVLNLRATSAAIRSETDRAIKTLMISDSQALRAFSDSDGFGHLETLSIDVIDQASTEYFAQALAARPRPGLTLILMQGYANLRVALTTLSRVPLAAFVLKSPNLDDQTLLRALRHFLAPITLIGVFTRPHFAALSGIPTLRSLLVLSHNFDEHAARLLSSHGALKFLALPLTPTVSPRCVALLASIASLRQWRLTEMVYGICPLSTAVAEALAANRSLEKLVIKSHTAPISSASFQALSRSETLKKLEISVCPGLEYLGNLATLEHLHLNGRCQGSPPISQQAAASVTALVNLRSLCILGAQFADDALTTLLTVSRAEKLYLKSVSLADVQLDALLTNVSLKELTLVDTALTPEQTATLLAHPTLAQLRIGSHHYKLLPGSRNFA